MIMDFLLQKVSRSGACIIDSYIGVVSPMSCSHFQYGIFITVAESLQIRSIVDSSLQCVAVELESLTDTTGIASYTVVALLGDTEVSQGTSDDAVDLVVEVCGLSLCNNDYMFRAAANGGSICPSSLTAITDLTLSGE